MNISTRFKIDSFCNLGPSVHLWGWDMSKQFRGSGAEIMGTVFRIVLLRADGRRPNSFCVPIEYDPITFLFTFHFHPTLSVLWLKLTKNEWLLYIIYADYMLCFFHCFEEAKRLGRCVVTYFVQYKTSIQNSIARAKTYE
jgi:hypothetical protein